MHTFRTLPHPAAFQRAKHYLQEGQLVAFPTETVYGLGADATLSDAIARVYAVKGRPFLNPLIAHVRDLIAAEHEAIFTPLARKLAEAFWPGPLTLVLPIAPTCQVAPLARAGLETIALRIPAHPVAQELLHVYERPLVAPSANKSGYISPTHYTHVLSDLDGHFPLLLEGEAYAHQGLESTILSCLEDVPKLLRPGTIPREVISDYLGFTVKDAGKKSPTHPIAPGQLTSHYAPHAPLRLFATEPWEGEAILDFAGSLSSYQPLTPHYLDLSPEGDLRQAATHLFAFLRQLDAVRPKGICVAPIPSTGLGEAIQDRLQRAAIQKE